jgi:hypothetical protein
VINTTTDTISNQHQHFIQNKSSRLRTISRFIISFLSFSSTLTIPNVNKLTVFSHPTDRTFALTAGCTLLISEIVLQWQMFAGCVQDRTRPVTQSDALVPASALFILFAPRCQGRYKNVSLNVAISDTNATHVQLSTTNLLKPKFKT